MKFRQIHKYIKFENMSISVMLAILFISYTLLGSTSDYSMYISMMLYLVWIIITLISNEKALMSGFTTPQALAFIVYMFFFFFSGIYVGGIEYTAKSIGQALLIFSPMIIFEYYRRVNLEKLKIILFFTLPFIAYLIIKSLTFYSQHNDAARKLAANGEVFGDLAIGGGYSLAFAAAILAIYLVEMLVSKNVRGWAVKAVIVIFISLLCTLVFSTKSTLTIIWLGIGIVLTLILNPISKNVTRNSLENIQNRKLNNLLLILKLSTLISIVSLLLLFFKEIGLFLVKLTLNKSDVISLRLNELGVSMFSGIENSEYVMYRLDRPLHSVSSFLDSPLVGRGYEYGYVYANSLPYMGGHSEWADALANMGLFGAIPFLLIFYFVIRNERQVSKNYTTGVYVFVFVLLGLFNPLRGFQPMYIIMFVIPALTLFVFNTDQRKSKSV